MTTSHAPTRVRFEHHPGDSALGIGEAAPRLSWVVPFADPGWAQLAYEVEVTRAGAAATFTVESPDQVLVPWPGAPLDSRERAVVRVRVRQESWSGWSEPVTVEAGLLAPHDWAAQFVGPLTIGGLGAAAPLLQGSWDLPEDIVEARMYVTAHGVYELSLNGCRVGDEQLAPGWTSYQRRLRYQTHDVTTHVRGGKNHVEALLGNGWWRGKLTWNMTPAQYGDRLALLAQLEVVTANGERHVFTTDESWTAVESGVLADDLYEGQVTDLRPRSDVAPERVVAVECDPSVLVAPDGPPMRVTEVIAAQRVWRSPSGKQLVDFGQNLVGWCRLTTRGLAPGTRVTIRHAEVLENAELGVRPLRNALATDTWFVAGGDEELLEPTFTFHGFRYAEVEGPDPLAAEDISAVVIGSDMDRRGWFESSHELLNRFHENVVWGMRGNFLDVPTDCPQRDERLGWTGDIQVFGPTAQFLMDSTGFLASWLKDLSIEQKSDGTVPFVVPDVLRDGMASAAWSDAATILPWTLYERSGDRGVLERQLPSMTAWVRRMVELSTDDLWAGGFQFGDWLDPTSPPDDPLDSKADKDVIATAHLIRSAEILRDAAAICSDPTTSTWAGGVAERSRRAFQREYVTGGGRILSDSQTVYALALAWDLLETPEQQRRAAARLADLVRVAGFRIATGFVGTPLVADALSRHGHSDVAYRLLLQTECPSWLYPVTMGATTVWERWDSMLPDGSINPGQMTSFNHYALGAVADWLHRRVAGLAPLEPGYRQLLIAPLPHVSLTSAGARHVGPYGEASVEWQLEGPSLTVHATVPVGVQAEVRLPGVGPFLVEHGTFTWTSTLPVRVRSPRPSVRQAMDDAETWSVITHAVLNCGLGGMGRVDDEQALAKRLEPYLDAAVSDIPAILTLGGNDPGLDRMVELLGGLAER